MAVYLDHNATTALDEGVLEAMLPYLRNHYGNPSSAHSLGRPARGAINKAREQLAELVNAAPEQIIFTSGGTEANNLALKGALSGSPAGGRFAISAIEHASLRGPAQALAGQGWQLDTIAVDKQGRVSLDDVQTALTHNPRLVSIMLGNNETGVLQDIAGINKCIKNAATIFHTDAVQALGKIKVDFAASGAHLMSLSAHKIYGPKGIGALVMDKAIAMEPLLHGGAHERGKRAGTENVAAIVGFGAAAQLVRTELAQRQAHWLELRNYLMARLRELPGVVIFAEQAEHLPNTVLISVPQFQGETLLAGLDQAGFMLSSGSACTSGNLAPSHVLVAMGVEPHLLRNVLRISLGKDTTRAELDQFLAALHRLMAQCSPWQPKTRAGNIPI